MTLLRTSPLAPLGALALCGVLLAGCTPPPEPKPTPTAAFASEEEAFAAAEETYRAYNNASNRSEDTADYLIGAALTGDIDSKRYLKDNGLRLEGDSAITQFTGVDADTDLPVATINAVVCLDVTKSRVIDSDSKDVTPADRANIWKLAIVFVGSKDGLLISESTPLEDERC